MTAESGSSRQSTPKRSGVRSAMHAWRGLSDVDECLCPCMLFKNLVMMMMMMMMMMMLIFAQNFCLSGPMVDVIETPAKNYLKIVSAFVVCCKFLLTFNKAYYLCIETNSVDNKSSCVQTVCWKGF